ncbi:MAG: hypothetical protein GTO41_06325 [Burkholderiales bacterium]|nr:hypothetical protein [Burkholderiales bacterium]
MSDADLHAELLRWRKQVEEFSRARKRQQAKIERNAEKTEANDEHAETEHAIRKQIEDLMKMLQDEISDMPAMPTLGIFVLGVLVGRYLR